MPDYIVVWFRLIEVLLPPLTPYVVPAGQTGLQGTGSILVNELDQTTTYYTGIVIPDSISPRIVCTGLIALLCYSKASARFLSHDPAHDIKKSEYEILLSIFCVTTLLTYL